MRRITLSVGTTSVLMTGAPLRSCVAAWGSHRQWTGSLGLLSPSCSIATAYLKFPAHRGAGALQRHFSNSLCMDRERFMCRVFFVMVFMEIPVGVQTSIATAHLKFPIYRGPKIHIQNYSNYGFYVNSGKYGNYIKIFQNALIDRDSDFRP